MRPVTKKPKTTAANSTSTTENPRWFLIGNHAFRINRHRSCVIRCTRKRNRASCIWRSTEFGKLNLGQSTGDNRGWNGDCFIIGGIARRKYCALEKGYRRCLYFNSPSAVAINSAGICLGPAYCLGKIL